MKAKIWIGAALFIALVIAALAILVFNQGKSRPAIEEVQLSTPAITPPDTATPATTDIPILLSRAAVKTFGYDTATPATTDTPILPTGPVPRPNYIQSEADTFQAELGQLFALRHNQTVQIPTENLSITHTTDIEFECPADADCEVPLIATDYFEVTQAGQSLGQRQWQPEMVFGDYVLTTARFYSGYEYKEHQFEIILAAERQETVVTAQQTRMADTTSATVSLDCGASVWQYAAGQGETPEVHMLGIYESGTGQVDVHLERTVAPIVLVLSAYNPTEWRIHTTAGVSLQKIILNGYNPHTLIGAEGIPLIDRSDPVNNVVQYVYTWNTSDLGYQNGLAPAWVYQMESIAGAPLNTFTGCRQASEFTIR